MASEAVNSDQVTAGVKEVKDDLTEDRRILGSRFLHG